MSESKGGADSSSNARDLTAFQRNILVILSEEPMYGLAIKRELEAYYDDEVNHGRLYPNLDELVERGLIEKSQLDKRTNQYALAAQGFDTVLDQLDWTFSKMFTDKDRADQVRELVDEES